MTVSLKLDGVTWMRTARYGSIKTGQLFKVGKRGDLVLPRNLSEARFMAVQNRSTLDITRMVLVCPYRLTGGRVE